VAARVDPLAAVFCALGELKKRLRQSEDELFKPLKAILGSPSMYRVDTWHWSATGQHLHLFATRGAQKLDKLN
jgi:hypothetical protein